MTQTTLAARIAAASKEVGGKLKADATNTQQNYDYLSADLILSRAGQALADQGIACLPAVTDKQVYTTPNPNDAKKCRYDVTVNMMFTLTDGTTQFELPFVGCGSDYAVPDKAVYKAITSGHKYFLMKLLNIGEGNEDGEHESETPSPATKAPRPQTPAPEPQPEAPKLTRYEADMLHAWDGDIAAAHMWAVAEKACENIFEAQQSLRKIVEGQFGGRLHTGNRDAVLLAFLRRQVEKLAIMAQLAEPEAA